MHQLISNRTAVSVAVAAVIAIAAPAAADGRLTRTQTLISVFAQTCLTNAGTPKRLIAQSSATGAKPMAALTAPQARAFLRGHVGHVWALPKSAGRAVIVLRDDGVCSLFARRWTGTNIDGHISALFKGIEAFNLEEVQRIDGPLRMVSYILVPAGPYRKKLTATANKDAPPAFRLITTTNQEPNAASQLAISLSTKRH